MERTSFVFMKEWWNALMGMPEKVRAEVYVAIVEYAFTGEAPKLKSMGQMAFNFIQAALDAQAHQEELRRARAEAGKKGAQAKWDKQGSAHKKNDGQTKQNEKKGAELLETRKMNFRKTLIPYEVKYGKPMINDFFEYWTETNKSRTKMRFEMQKTWETAKRLATWATRDNDYNGKRNDKQKNEAEQDAIQIMQRIKARATNAE